MGKIIVEHPSYGIVELKKVSGGNSVLYGSFVDHNEKICLTVKHSNYEQNLHKEYYFDKEDIVKVEMSYTQFADLISNMNSGLGVPCTLIYTEKDGNIPKCDFEVSKQQFKEEFKKNLDIANTQINELIENLKQNLSKIDKEDIYRTLDIISSNLNLNSNYLMSTFVDQMNKIVLDAKSEIEAFTQQKIMALCKNNESIEQKD